jgi:hypothetical protein
MRSLALPSRPKPQTVLIGNAFSFCGFSFSPLVLFFVESLRKCPILFPSQAQKPRLQHAPPSGASSVTVFAAVMDLT